MRGKTLPAWALPAAILGVAVVLRLIGIDYGLPHVFNSDEPHHINVAVSFGRGSLDPGVFKYPTLWMYVLFAAYGLYFLLWSGFGLLHSVGEFGEMFVWAPSAFYLIGRVLAAAFSLWAVVRLYRLGSSFGEKRVGLWAAAFLAASPTLIVSAHAAKPESLMFFFSVFALANALAYVEDGREASLRLCAIFAGLAVSTQYNAAPMAVLVPAAWWGRRIRLGRRGGDPLTLVRASVFIPLAFLLGSPYVLLNGPAFTRDIMDHIGLNALSPPAGTVALLNAAKFGGQAVLGTILLLAGIFHLAGADRARGVVLIVPLAVLLLCIGSAPEGTWERYLLAGYPALALIAAVGVEGVIRRLKKVPLKGAVVQSVVVAGLILPGTIDSLAFDQELLRPDTRTLSTRWIEQSIPQGASILIDQDHASPRLSIVRAQAEEMAERTAAAGHPRERYYRLMASGHPGGGYRVYQVRRDYADLHSGGWHVQWSAEGRSMLDVREGLKAVRRAGIQWVVLTSFGARMDRSPDLERFLREIQEKGRLRMEFREVRGMIVGPRIRIYEI